MRKPNLHSFAALLFLASAAAEEWTRFRGENGLGVSTATRLPAEFGNGKNMAWRAAVRDGKSSPVLTRHQVFLTAFDNGKLYTQCFDRAAGKLLWERSVDRVHDQLANRLNHPAAITPVTDGENVYSFFKDYGLVSYDASGKERWRTPLGPFANSMGLGASPILAGGSVILLADQSENSFVAAFDQNNGEMRWRSPRDEVESWGTPLAWRPPGGPLLVLTASRGRLGAYVSATGMRILDQHGIATTIVGSPILNVDILYVFGYGSETPAPFSKQLGRFDKNGDGRLTPDEYGADAFTAGIARYRGNRDLIVTEEEWNNKQLEVIGPDSLGAYKLQWNAGKLEARELWRHEKGFTAVIPSPLLYRGLLYLVKNGGILTAFDAHTGKVLKTGRITGALGGYSASPVAADGKIYLPNEEGKVAVVRAGADWAVIAANHLDESCHATPAIAGGEIYLRTSQALYRFESR